MYLEEGVDPEIFKEKNSDISKAKAGKDLFQTNKKSTYNVDTKQLFNKERKVEIHQNQDEMLFESTIEFANYNSQGRMQEKESMANLMIIGICIILVVTYIVYVFQRRSIQKMIINSDKSIKRID
ncbi:MAG: hypothetical protein ACK5KR_07900 [Breznakia sp.]